LVRNPFEQHDPGQIPLWVKENDVDTMIVKGIGSRAIGFFSDLGITVVKATGDNAKVCIEDYLSGKTDDTDPGCNHNHSHEHHHRSEDECKKQYGVVAVTLQDKSLDAPVDERFARGKYICIFNGENGSIEFLDNNPEEEHGVGPKMIGFLSNKGVNTIIAKSLGQNATIAAKEAGMKTYEAVDGTGNENFQKLWSGELKAL
jgi:predicted Fe-Mo cluster-binding NifX family protein